MAATPSAALEKQGEPAAATLSASAQSLEKGKGVHLLLKSLDELNGLSSVLSTFSRRWDELQKHLDFIRIAMEDRFRQLDTNDMTSLQQPLLPSPEGVSVADAPIPDLADMPIRDFVEDLSPSGRAVENFSTRSELETLLATMDGRGLRKYVASHMTDITKLRGEVPAVLKRAPNPAKLVLNCIGRFYLQGSKAYSRDSPMVPARQASVLILEFFLLTGCSESEIEPSLKKEAEVAAITWRKRLIDEGGVSKANSMDARGLLLFVGSYGIPSVFENEDLDNLIRLSSPREIAVALRRSRFILERIPDIIQMMVKNGMHIQAVDAACAFGIEEKFPLQTILTSFLHESKEAWKRTRREAQGSSVLLKEAYGKQLAALKSLIKCLEDHKVDSMKLLAGLHINDQIINLEKEIADLDRKIEEKAISKRKVDEVESLNMRSQEVKRPWPTPKVSPQGRPVIMLSQEQRAVGLFDGNSLYDGLAGKYFFDGYSGVLSLTGAVTPDRSGAGLLSGNVLDTRAGIGSGLAPEAGARAGISMGNSGILSTGVFPGIGGALLGEDGVGKITNNAVGPYGWHGDGAFNDMGLQASSGNGLLGPPPSLEQSFVGLATTTSLAIANQSSGSDLYQFADAIFEGESYYRGGSHAGNTMPPASGDRSSYLH